MAFAHALQSTRVVDAGGSLDGSELRRAAAALFSALQRAGLGDDGVVGLALDPARALVPALLAAWGRGATVVLVPPALGPAELAAVASGLSPALIVTAEA